MNTRRSFLSMLIAVAFAPLAKWLPKADAPVLHEGVATAGTVTATVCDSNFSAYYWTETVTGATMRIKTWSNKSGEWREVS